MGSGKKIRLIPDQNPPGKNRYNCFTCERRNCPLIRRETESQTFSEIYHATKTDLDFKETLELIAGLTEIIGCCSHTGRSDPHLLEQFSSICHEEWAAWATDIKGRHELMLTAYMDLLRKYQIDTGNMLVGAAPFYATERARLKRWSTLINTPYADLTEDLKDLDREWGRKMVEVCDGW